MRPLLITSVILAVLLSVTYAVAPSDYDAVINITDKAECDNTTLNFHMADGSDYKGPWAPGLAMKSVVHLKNGNYFSSVTLANLGVWITDLTAPERIAFAENMLMTIKQGQDGKFATTLYNGPLQGLLYQEGSSEYGGQNVNVTLGSFGSADLEYTLAMAENAGREMQGLTAKLAFYFNMNNIPAQKKERKDLGDDGDFPILPAAPTQEATKNWYDDCILALLAHNIIITEVDGPIRPQDLITRGEAAVLLGRALGLPEDKASAPSYLDKIPEQYKGYINATTKAWVFRGYPLISEALPGRLFKADNFISREELFCVMVRAYSKMPAGQGQLEFDDTKDIAQWALEDIRTGVNNNIIAGYPDKTFKPKQYMTRAEAFSLVCRFQGYHTNHDSDFHKLMKY